MKRPCGIKKKKKPYSIIEHENGELNNKMDYI